MVRRSTLSLVVLVAMVVLAAGSDGFGLPEPDRAERLEAERAAAERAAAEADAAAAAALAEHQAQVDARENVEACQRWAEAFNALSCLPEAARIDPATVCPASLDLACDQKAYWDCMVDKTRCENGRPTRPDPAECPPPC